MKRDLLSIKELSKEEIEKLIHDTRILKRRRKEGLKYTPLEGRVLGLLFEKPSTRTRVSFETGMYQMGGDAIFMSPRELQLGRGETIEDTAKVLSRYIDVAVLRVYSHETLERFAQSAEIPVINGLSDLLHPCQILADIYTIYEKLGRYENFKLVFVGDGNNIANSWINLAAKLDFELIISCPKGYEPDAEILEDALKAGAKVKVSHNPGEDVKDAHVIYTDVWCSMGQEDEKKERLKAFRDFQVNDELMNISSAAYFMHCLPAHRGEEVTDSVIDGPRSIVWDEAENRLHMQKAIILFLLGINP
ncbi:MAG: ornithine carbamoyltransferase [Deferribacteres bacterium]|nr:ornithine carbamoyltransferase [Deferribacteres bacterium]